MKNKVEFSAALTIVGVCILFAMAIAVTLIAPNHIDPSWHKPYSAYQKQMHEVSDPNIYLSTSNPGGRGLQHVYHVKEGFTLLAFRESEGVRIVAPPELEKYVTKLEAEELTLTTKMLLLRKAGDVEKQDELQKAWKEERPDWEEKRLTPPRYEILELFAPEKSELFAVAFTDGIMESFAEEFTLLGEVPPYSIAEGAIYIANPREYRIAKEVRGGERVWVYNENGEPVEDLEELTHGKLKFLSRAALIEMGEAIYRAEGCWYCHTDQTRTLVQDVVLNGSADYPAPPSSANEYVYQKVTFPGTRRIGPDLSRVGIKRPSRDWHMSHFWSPQTESRGSIMPPFTHFFDDDPAGGARNPFGVPNYKFEAVFQYLMTKGTRFLPPSKAWWLGLDPMQTIDIIGGETVGRE